MLAYNLHLEKTAQLPELSNQGLKRQNQGDSSFFAVLQKEMDRPDPKAEKTNEARDGQKELNAEETQAKKAERSMSEKSSETESSVSNKTEDTQVLEKSLHLDQDSIEALLEDKSLLQIGLDKDAEAIIFDKISAENERFHLGENFDLAHEDEISLNDFQIEYLMEEMSEENEESFKDGLRFDKNSFEKQANLEEGIEVDSSLAFLVEPEENRSKIKALSSEEQEALLQKLLTGSANIQNLEDIEAEIESLTEPFGIEKEIPLFGKENALISVIDERTPSNEKKETGFTKSIQFDAKNQSASISLSLDPQNSLSKEVGFGNEKEIENRFQSMLSQEIKNSASDLVKTGSIILKDNNAGLINLILKPESLGDVKIRLQISDTLISAKILVDSKEALQAFKESLGTLKAAFEQGGFETGNFDLSWSGQGESGQGKNEQNAKAHFYADSLPELVQEAQETDEKILALMKNALQYGTSIVNVVA